MCAEYFLSSLKDVDGDGTRGEVLGRNGPPTVLGGSSGGALLARMRTARAEAHRLLRLRRRGTCSLSCRARASPMLAAGHTHTYTHTHTHTHTHLLVSVCA